MGILKKDNKKAAAKKKTSDEVATTGKDDSSQENMERGASSSDSFSAELVAEAVAKSNKFTHRIVLLCVVLILLIVGGYGAMAWQTSSRVSALNENIQATLSNVEALNEAVEKLTEGQGAFKEEQGILGDAVKKAEASINNMQEILPNAAAKKVSAETVKVVSQIQDLKVALDSQGKDIGLVSKVVGNLGAQLQEFEERLENVQRLSSDVEALVVLEKQQYLNVLKRQADIQEKQTGPNPVKVPRDPNMVFYSIQSGD
jgi:predicted  nucleic acid-binding Zn-ribbon protein